LFEQFQHALKSSPEASLVSSLSESPRLGEFLPMLDPDLSLDWSGQSFQGLPSLRHKVLTRTGTGSACTIGDVLITAGTAEANFLAINQLVMPGDEIVVDTPGWPQPLVLAQAIGAQIRRLPRYESCGWAFDMDELAGLVNENTKLIFICNPNNPTGHLLSPDELDAVIKLADRVGAWLLTDEVYRGLEWSGGVTASAAAMYERGISTGSVSKVLGLQGLRIGWLICQDKALIKDAIVLREDSSEIMNIMGEAIANLALGDDYYPAALEKARAVGRANLDLLDDFIGKSSCLAWQRPAAGLIGFARLEGSALTHADAPANASAFSKRLLGSPWRTFVMPGSAYGAPNHLRLGAGGATSELRAALDRLRDFIASLY
jgi:aspartate/methionine/tyrosine aminotransferase